MSYLCIALVLSGCSFGKPEASSRRGKAPAPAVTVSGAERVSSISAAPTAMETFRALAKPQGLKFTPLFAEPVDDTDARMKRVEDAVQSLRNDFDTVVPSMVRLVAIEKDMKELVSQLQSLTGEPAAAPVDEVEQTNLDEVEQTNPDEVGKTAIPIPGEDVAEGTETTEALVKAEVGTAASTSPVTPEAASQGMPPEGAASPIPAPKAAVKQSAPSAQNVAPPAQNVTPAAASKPAPVVPTAPKPEPTPAPEKAAQQQPPKATPPAVAPSGAGTSVEWAAPYGAKSAEPVPAKPAPVAPPAKEAASPTTPIPLTSEKPAAVAPKPAAAQPAPQAAPVQASKTEVRAVRVADHPDKTRVVLDISAQIPVKAEISADGKQLVIDLTGTEWKEKSSWLADSGVLVSGWTYKNGKLYIDLIYPSTLKAQQVLPPNGTPYYRFVLDVFSRDVHQ